MRTAAKRRPTAEEGRPSRILLADDSELFLDSTADLLEQDGYICTCAHDAHEATAELSAATFDLLIADIKMPGNANLELLEEVKHTEPPLPVILVTAYPSVATAVSAVGSPVLDYLIKPFEFGELRERVGRAITKGRSWRSAKDLRDLMAANWSESVGVLRETMDRTAIGVPAEAIPPPTRPAHTSEQPAGSTYGLSPREHEIIEALTRGERVKAIAATLSISAHTVRNHLRSIYHKLGVHSQIELLALLRRPNDT